MNIFYYFLGSVVFIIFKVLYDVFRNGESRLTVGLLIDYGILGILAAIAFFIADYALFKKKS